MSYSLHTTVRIVDWKVYKPIYARVEVDTCAFADRRYRIYRPHGDLYLQGDYSGVEGKEYRWDELILEEDDARTRFGKWRTNRALLELSDLEQKARLLAREVRCGFNSTRRNLDKLEAMSDTIYSLQQTLHI